MEFSYLTKLKTKIEHRYSQSMLKEYVFPREMIKSSSFEGSLDQIEIYDLNKQNEKRKDSATLSTKITSPTPKQSQLRLKIDPRDEYHPQNLDSNGSQPKRLMGKANIKHFSPASSSGVGKGSFINGDLAKFLIKEVKLVSDSEAQSNQSKSKFQPLKSQLNSAKKSQILKNLSLSKVTSPKVQTSDRDAVRSQVFSISINNNNENTSSNMSKSQSFRKLNTLKQLKPVSQHEAFSEKAFSKGYLQLNTPRLTNLPVQRSTPQSLTQRHFDPFKRLFQSKSKVPPTQF